MKTKGIFLKFIRQKMSEKFNELVESLSALPSIGKKTALRLAYTLCKDKIIAMRLNASIENALRFIKPCACCLNLSEHELCEICSDETRDRNLLCIVESAKDILILEESGGFNGLYFVLEDLEQDFEKLVKMIKKFQCKEVIFALTHSLNSEALIFYVEEKLKDFHLKFSKIAQGIPSGVSLENVDLISLHKAMAYRVRLE